MTESEYTTEVRSILDRHTDEARSQLAKLPDLLPDAARSIELTIFVDQDGEGFLTVRAALDGPDLYVINKAIDDCALLFDTKMVDGELVPPLPLMEPFDEDFSVHDALTDCAAEWLTEVWNGASSRGIGVPVSILSPDGYGSKCPIKLSP
ncbi:DUF6389 family protein [Haloferula sargassicola]|uniref:DUF6389 family protein n=1 Tax=Haloferula sargassicola TaxID=490096 RepID=UPI0033657CD1